MNKKMLLLPAAAALVISGCSMPTTAADEVAVHKGGGPFEGKKSKGCIESGKRQQESAFDEYFYYPSNQSTYDFTGDKDSDAKPITVVSSDNQTLSVPGQINFDLNTNCDILTAFHDNIGRRYGAYTSSSGEARPDGWRKMLNLYIGRAADATMDRIAKQYTWRELYSDPAIKDKINSEVNSQIQKLVNQQTDGDQTFFQNFQTLVLQPQPSDTLRDALQAEEASKAQAQATETKAKADAKAAQAAASSQVAQKEAELKVAQLQKQIKQQEIAAFGGARAWNENEAIKKGINPWQPSYGQSLVDAK